MVSRLDRLRIKASEILWRLRRGADVEAAYRAVCGNLHKETSNGLALVRYEPGGQFSYDLYRRIQEGGNKKKILQQSVTKDHIKFLCRILAERLTDINFGICHGTRTGAEQRWFHAHLPSRPRVIGTEIAATARWFRNTVQWDFHEPNPAWIGRADFVYSNSWDHAYDPAKAFHVWAESLRVGGLMLLDHTPRHLPSATTALDPFGAELEALIGILQESCGELGKIDSVLPADDNDIVVVFRRHEGVHDVRLSCERHVAWSRRRVS